MRKKAILAIFIFHFFLSHVVLAGLNTWTPTDGPEGGEIRATAVDPFNPEIVYAAASGVYSSKIYKSTDGGKHWLSLAILQGSPAGIVIDSFSTSTLYFATFAGIYKSLDGGLNWNSISNGLNDFVPECLAIDPQNNQVLFTGGGFGLFKTTDAGTNWSRIQSDQLPPIIVSIVIDPKNSLTIYAAGGPGNSISRSDDGGNLWYPAHPQETEIFRLIINPIDPDNLFAIGYGAEIYRTTDGGTSWSTILTNGQLWRVTAIALDPNLLDLYAGQYTKNSYRILKSKDQGNTWERAAGLGWLKPPINSFVFTSEYSTFFAATAAGMFKTQSAGKKWSFINTGLNAANTQNLLKSPSGIIYAGTIHNGLPKRTGSSQKWKTIGRLPGEEIVSMQTNPHNAKTIYIAVRKSRYGKGVFKSQDAGVSWVSANNGLAELDIHDIKIAPSKPEVLYVSTDDSIYRSSDGAESWQKLEWNCGGHGIILAVDPTNYNRINAGYYYSGTWSDPGFSRSIDGGRSWNCGLDPQTIPVTMAVDPVNQNTIYVGGYDGGEPFGGEDGLFKSTDAGNTWTMMMNGLPPGRIYSFAIDPIVSTTVYVSVKEGVFKSTDGGNNWTSFNSGLENILVRSILVDPADTNTVYAATSLGVFSIEQIP